MPLFLILCAAVLMLMHTRTWRAQRQLAMESAERDFHWRQYRRRMQSSGMLALVAVGIFAGQLVAHVAGPVLAIIFWGVVGLLVLWIAVLAAADIVATKYYYGRLRQDCVVEQAKLKSQLRRIESVRRNGKPSVSQPSKRPEKSGPGADVPGQ